MCSPHDRVKDHLGLKYGWRTRLYCCQDLARKKKYRPSQKTGAKPRENSGMPRFLCQSSLRVTYHTGMKYESNMGRVFIRLEHHYPYVEYEDVGMPEEAKAMIQEHLEWLSPIAMVTKIRSNFPNVTPQQVHNHWTKLSQPFWRRDDDQLASAEILLREFDGDVILFEPVDVPDGVEILCWSMKRIVKIIEGKVVEIGLDATCQYR
jgi:hypothetical protein